MLSLEKKIYQLIISRLDGDRICDQAYQESIFTLVRKGIGGFIIFGGNRDDVTPFINKLQSMAETPLFIASDIERGVGQQILGFTNFPCQMAVRAAISKDNTEDLTILRDIIRTIAIEAIDAGINMPLIPVLDVNSNPDNPIICTRAFSDNPEDVSFFGLAYIRELERLNLISCAKHFPGHGDTSIDSHISLPQIAKSYDELVNSDIRPFKEAVRTGVSSIMIGHLLIPAIDDSVPASLSKKVITDVLRKGLGFNGLVMTDALNMSAISAFDNVAARCIDAGADIILHPPDADSTVRELANAVETKLISEEAIDTAVDRIIKAKSRLSQIKKIDVDYGKNNSLSKLVREMSITVVKEKSGILPVTDDSNIHVVIAGEERLCEHSLWMARFEKISMLTKGDENVLVGWAPPTNKLGEGGQCPPYTIVAIFSEVAAWRGRSGIYNQEVEKINKLIRNSRYSIVISFGSPYILRYFKDADVLIAAYEANKQAQEAVIKCLCGEIGFRGRLPVSLFAEV